MGRIIPGPVGPDDDRGAPSQPRMRVLTPAQAVIRQPTMPISARNGSPPSHAATPTPPNMTARISAMAARPRRSMTGRPAGSGGMDTARESSSRPGVARWSWPDQGGWMTRLVGLSSGGWRLVRTPPDFASREPNDTGPLGIVLRTLRHQVPAREPSGEVGGPGRRTRARQGAAKAGPDAGIQPGRGARDRPSRRRASGQQPGTGGVSRHLPLLPVLPAVHLRHLLEPGRRRVPGVRTSD